MFDSNKKTLILGASGLLGSQFVNFLRSKSHNLILHSNSKSDESFISADLSQSQICHNFLGSVNPEFIFNFSALTDVDKCESDPVLCYNVNVGIPLNVARWIAEKSPSTQLVHISSDHVYDSESPCNEEEISPVNFYAYSKLASELAIQRAPSVSLRTNFFGNTSGSPRTSYSDWVLNQLEAGRPIKVNDDIDFCPLNMSTLFECLEAVLMKFNPGVYNLGSKDGFSKAQFCKEIARAFGYPETLIEPIQGSNSNHKARRPKGMLMDCSEFESVFDFKLPTLKEEIQKLKL